MCPMHSAQVIGCPRSKQLHPAQVYERKSRLQQRRRSTQRYNGPFTYWDLHDFAALVVVAACLSYCGFKLGVRRGSQAPASQPFTTPGGRRPVR